MNKLSRPYYLDEPTFILRSIILFFDEHHVSKQKSPRWGVGSLRQICGNSVSLCPIKRTGQAFVD